jgi:hypothetical protein
LVGIWPLEDLHRAIKRDHRFVAAPEDRQRLTATAEESADVGMVGAEPRLRDREGPIVVGE